jgi:hypothetical protein
LGSSRLAPQKSVIRPASRRVAIAVEQWLARRGRRLDRACAFVAYFRRARSPLYFAHVPITLTNDSAMRRALLPARR